MADDDILDDTGDDTPTGGTGDDTPKGGDDDKQQNVVDKDGEDTVSGDVGDDLLSDDEEDAKKSGETSYDFEVPEEFADVPVDEAALDAFKAKASELGLTQEQFQALAVFDMQNAVAAGDASVEAWGKQVADWRQAVIDDKDIGGDNLKATRDHARAVMAKFADPDLVAFFKSPSDENPTGLGVGNHPAVVKFLARIGRALGDPDFVGGEEPTMDVDATRRMYPSMFKD